MKYPHHVHDIAAGDPCIFADPPSGKYYMTATFFSLGQEPAPFRRESTITAMVSEDLIHWSDPVTIFDCGGTDFWGKAGYSLTVMDKDRVGYIDPSGYPATEMHCFDGRYYLSGTAMIPGHTGRPMILRAENPLGPYTWIENEPYGPEGWDTVDCTLYRDPEGHPWIIYSHLWFEHSDGQMLLQPLSDDFGHCTGGPMILWRGSDAVWSDDQIWSKTDGGAVAEAPYLHRMEDGSLLMLWTGRSRTGYALSTAKSRSGKIWGPWELLDRPIYGHDGGHGALFRRLSDGQLMMSMHLCDEGPKMLVIFEMEERGGGLHIVNEITGNWMTTAGGSAKPFRRKKASVEEPI